MKGEHSTPADEVLRHVRSSADPLPDDEARVLAQIERRLGMLNALAAFRRDAPAPLPQRVAGGARRGASSLRTRVPLQRLLGALPRLALLSAFGASAAAIGYGVGTQGLGAGRKATAVVSPPAVSLPRVVAPHAVPVPEVVLPPEAVSPPAAFPPGGLPPPAALPPAPVVVLSPPPTPSPMEPAPERAMPRPPAAEQRSSARSEPARSSAVPVEPPVPTTEPEPIRLREALQLLERARAALRLGLAGDALEALALLERRNPGTLLEQERLVTRTLALCALGEVSKARDARQQLERLDPASIYRGQLEASCAKAK